MAESVFDFDVASYYSPILEVVICSFSHLIKFDYICRAKLNHMSLLTNRKKTTDPPTNGTPRPKTAEELLKKNDEEMASKGFKPKLDEKGNRVSTRNGNSETFEYVKTTVTTSKGRPSAPIMEANQYKKTGQKQVGSRYWDDEKKQWKVSQ